MRTATRFLPLFMGRSRPRVALLTLFGLGSFGAGACASSLGAGARSARGDSPYAAVEQLGRVLVQVENDYVDPVDREKLVNGAIKGMVAELDPHSGYMPPDEFQAFESDTAGQFGGVGVEVATRNGELLVLAPIEGSPASRAGIRSGDVILTVDGKDPTFEPFDKLVKHLRGAPGSHVRVGVRRKGAKDPLAFDLIREVIRVASVSSKLLRDRVAYVRVKQFQEHTHDELLAAAAKIRRRAGAALSGIMLDLRSDPGGLVDQAADVADEFLDEGIIYTTRHRGAVVEEVRAHAGGAFTKEPCVVLVDEYTASASELVAGALQDRKRATVVGEQTFGKGSVQAILALPGGAGMRLTIARYYTPAGHAIQADGVHPEVLVTLPKAEGAASYREADLENHLAGEPGPAREQSGAQPGPHVITVASAPDAAVLETIESGSEATGVADDPEQGTDAVLKIAFQWLRRAR